jgi:tetratricopeptide (TPR) repeat protein
MGGTYIFKFSGNRILRSVKLLLGVDILERIIPSAGIRASIKIFDFWFGFSEKKILFGFSVNYKKRIEIKEIVKKVEVIKEVPVYVEKKEKKVIRKKRKKRKTKEKEKKPAISEQELEVYYIKGIEYYKREMLEEALKEWEKIMNLNPDYKDVKELYEKTKKRLERLRRLSE